METRLVLIGLLSVCQVVDAIYLQGSCSLQAGYDCYGNDISNVPASTPQDCCDLCSNTTGCAAFTHDQYGPTGQKTPTCYLKSACSDKKNKSDAVAGIPGAPPSPQTKYVNNYDGNNPLKIVPDPTRSNNYFIILGDWGKSGGPSDGDCMDQVAKMILRYADKQKQAGKTLLFIAVVGDNFYWTGVDPASSWDKQWATPYRTQDPTSPIYNVPWLAVLGNHDLGDTDGYAFCPDVKPLAKLQGQSYACQQFNADRNPTRPMGTERYWLPDFSYHYAIPDADVEVIAVDRNYGDIQGLGGDASGHADAFAKCGGEGAVASFLNRVGAAGDSLLKDRAANGTASTVLIINHYPGQCGRDTFQGELPPGRNVNVLCAYGHTHDQKCDTRNANGTCVDVLTGGGGGCCAPNVNLAGFTAVALDDNGGYSVDIDSADVRLQANQCSW